MVSDEQGKQIACFVEIIGSRKERTIQLMLP